MAQTILELLGRASGATPPPPLVDGRQSLTSYEPTMRDKLANWLLGETPSQTKKDFVQGLVGSRGMGATGMGLVDFTPAGVPMQSQEGYRERGLQGAAMPFIGGAGKVARQFGDATEHAIGQIGAVLDEKAAYYVKHGKEFVVHASDSHPLMKFEHEKAAQNYVDSYSGLSPQGQNTEKSFAKQDKSLWQPMGGAKPKQDLSVTETKIKGALDIPVPPAPKAQSPTLSKLTGALETPHEVQDPSDGKWYSKAQLVKFGGDWHKPSDLAPVYYQPTPTEVANAKPVGPGQASDSEVLVDLMKNINSKKAEVQAPSMKLSPEPFPKSVDPVKQMLVPGDLKKVEDRYQQAIAPLKINFPPRALEQGYETPAFRGMKLYAKGEEPNPVYNFKGDSSYGQMYSTDNPMLADMYSDYKLHHPGWDVRAGDFGEGSQISPLLLNTKDYHYYDAKGGDWRKHNSRAMDEARKLGKPGVIVDNVRDEPNSTENLPSPSKVFITFPSGASTAKSRFAERFDPTSPNMLHGIPVGAMIGSGLIMGQDGRPHKIEHMPEGYDPFASQNPENGT